MFLLLCSSMPDHHLTTTVQPYYKKPKKPIVTTTGFFLFWRPLCKTNIIYVPTQAYTALSQFSDARCRGFANPFGRTKKAHCHVLWQCAFGFDVILGNTA